MGISTHILDTASGRPAAGVAIRLDYFEQEAWVRVNDGITDADGRCKHLLAEGTALRQGVYRLRFETETYFVSLGTTGLYPYVEIAFAVRGSADQHFHIPLLLTQNSYTTYRGS